jgi:hypothetical protein
LIWLHDRSTRRRDENTRGRTERSGVEPAAKTSSEIFDVDELRNEGTAKRTTLLEPRRKHEPERKTATMLKNSIKSGVNVARSDLEL